MSEDRKKEEEIEIYIETSMIRAPFNSPADSAAIIDPNVKAYVQSAIDFWKAVEDGRLGNIKLYGSEHVQYELMHRRGFGDRATAIKLLNDKIGISELIGRRDILYGTKLRTLLERCGVRVLIQGSAKQDMVRRLAAEYRKSGVIPKAEKYDSWHVAFATIEVFDYTATMNLTHVRAAYDNAAKREDMEKLNAGFEGGYATRPILNAAEMLEELLVNIPKARQDQSGPTMLAEKPVGLTRNIGTW
jgi:hypothetical protein